MKKLFLSFALLGFILIKPGDVMAQNLVVSSSANLKSDNILKSDGKIDYRVTILGNFLEQYNSPLAPYAKDFIAYADEYNIDWRLVPAISGVESTFGKRIPSNSYNAYGWANGNYSFKSWEDSIKIVSKTLREKYYDRGANTVGKIARIYAPPSTTWAWKVNYFMNKIDNLPVHFDL
jgi:hypothetical protein